MDRAFLLEAGADGVGELLRNPARIVDVAILPQAIDRQPVQRSPAEGQIPLQAARVGAAGQAAGLIQQGKMRIDGLGLFRRRQAGPKRIKDGRVHVGGLLPVVKS